MSDPSNASSIGSLAGSNAASTAGGSGTGSASSTPDLSSTVAEPPNYRQDFIKFLFSLCVAQIAIFVAATTTIDPLICLSKLAVWSHLVVALLIVWSSWFAWRKTHDDDTNLSDRVLFGRSQFLTLIDICILIAYFILTHSSDIVYVDQGKKHLSSELESATAYRESRMLAIIFVLYLVWELVRGHQKGAVVNWLRPRIVIRYVPTILIMVSINVASYIGHHRDHVLSTFILNVSMICAIINYRFTEDQIRPTETWWEISNLRRIQSSLDKRAVLRATFLAAAAVLCWLGLFLLDFPDWASGATVTPPGRGRP